MRLFLDVCCLNRPFDDQQQTRIRLETIAVLHLLARVRHGTDEMIRSDSLDLEIRRNPDAERRERVLNLLSFARAVVRVGNNEINRAHQLSQMGIGAFDALHLACAESAAADVFLTTDDTLIRRGRRHSRHLRVRVENPLIWTAEVEQ